MLYELWHDDQKRLRADLPRPPPLPTPEWENAIHGHARARHRCYSCERGIDRRRGRQMFTRKIIVLLLSLTALWFSGCQGDRLKESSSVATGASGIVPLRSQG